MDGTARKITWFNRIFPIKIFVSLSRPNRHFRKSSDVSRNGITVHDSCNQFPPVGLVILVINSEVISLSSLEWNLVSSYREEH